MKLLISACLLGLPCRYDGKSKCYEKIPMLIDKFELVPFCPECYGGLPTPREPAEIVNNSVITQSGISVTEQYKSGASQALFLCKKLGITQALLKEKSPSCGKGVIYDGTFSKTVVHGNGITAQTLMDNGITVYGESEIDKLIDNNGD